MAKQDLIAMRLNSLNSEEPDITLAGTDPADVSLQGKDAYKSTAKIQQLFTDNTGKFNDKEFDKFYDSAVRDLNNLQSKSFSAQAFNPEYFWDSPYSKGQKTIKKPYQYFDSKDNPFINRQVALGRTLGTSSINSWSDPLKTESELAQGLKVLDGDTKKELDYTPEDAGLIEGFGFFSEPLVLATYNEDVKDERGNIVHAKGEVYYDENGLPRYETLNNRSLANKKVLSRWDTLTREGSFWNKMDFMDSDDIDKSITGTIAKTAVQLAPMLIGPIAPWYVGAYVAKNALDVGVDIARALGATTGDYREGDKSMLNGIEGFLKSTDSGMSEYGANHMLSFESIAQMMADSVFQLKGQRWIAEAPIKLTALKAGAKSGIDQRQLAKDFVKFNNMSPEAADQMASILAQAKNVPDFEKAQKMGGIISTAYMAATSAGEIADSARDLGLDAKDAAWMYAGYSGVLALLFRTDLGDWATQNIGLDPIRRMQKEAIKESAKGFEQALSGGTRKVAQEVTEEMAQEAASKGAMRGIKAGIQAGKKVASKIGDLFNNFEVETIGQGALGEGLEEITELTIQKGVENFYNLLNEAGMTATNKGLQYQYDAKELMAEYAATAFGGALGGMVFKGMDLATSPTRPTGKTLADLVTYGYADDIINTVKKMESKGELPGSNNLSAVLYKDSDGNTEEGIFQLADDANPNQQSFIANKIIDTVKVLEGIREANGIDPIQTTIADKQKFLGKIADLRTQSSMADDLSDIVNTIYKLSLEERQLLANPIAAKDEKKESTSDNPAEAILQLLAETKDPNEIEFKNKLEKTRKDLKEARKEYARLTSNESMDEYFREALFNMNDDLMDKLKTVNINTFSNNIAGMDYPELLKQLQVNPNLADKKDQVIQAYEEYRKTDTYKKDLRKTRREFEEANLDMASLAEKFGIYKQSLENLKALKDVDLIGKAVDLNPDIKIPESELGTGEEGVDSDDKFMAISNKAYETLQHIDNNTNEFFPHFVKIQSDRVATAYMRKVLDTTEKEVENITKNDAHYTPLFSGVSPVFDTFFDGGNPGLMEDIRQSLQGLLNPNLTLEEKASLLSNIGQRLKELNPTEAAKTAAEFVAQVGDGIDMSDHTNAITAMMASNTDGSIDMVPEFAKVLQAGIDHAKSVSAKIPETSPIKKSIDAWIATKEQSLATDAQAYFDLYMDNVASEEYDEGMLSDSLDYNFNQYKYSLNDLSLADEKLIEKEIKQRDLANNKERFEAYEKLIGYHFQNSENGYNVLATKYDEIIPEERAKAIKSGLMDYYGGLNATDYFKAVDYFQKLQATINDFDQVVGFKKQMDAKFNETAKSPLTEKLSPVYNFLKTQYENIAKQGAVEYANASPELQNEFKEVEKQLDLAEAMLIAMVRINPMVNAFRDAHRDWVVDELKDVRAVTIDTNPAQAKIDIDRIQMEIDALRFEAKYYKDLNEFNLNNTIRYLKKAFKINTRLKAKALVGLSSFLTDLEGVEHTKTILNTVSQYPGVAALSNLENIKELSDEQEAEFNAELGKAETLVHDALVSDLEKLKDPAKVKKVIDKILNTKLTTKDVFSKINDDLPAYESGDLMLYYAKLILGRTVDVDLDLMKIREGEITVFDDYNFAPLQGQIDAAEFSYVGAFADPVLFKLVSDNILNNSPELTFVTGVNTTGITGPAGSGKTSASLFLRNRMVLEGAKRMTGKDHKIAYMAAKETQYKAIEDNLAGELLTSKHEASGTTGDFLHDVFGLQIDEIYHLGLEKIKTKEKKDLTDEDKKVINSLCNETSTYKQGLQKYLVDKGLLMVSGGVYSLNPNMAVYKNLEGVKSLVIDEATHNDARVLAVIDILIEAVNKERKTKGELPIDIVYCQDDLQMGSTLPVLNIRFTSDRMQFLSGKRLPVAVRSEWNTINETLAGLQTLHEQIVQLNIDENFADKAKTCVSSTPVTLKMAKSQSGTKGFIGFRKTTGNVDDEINTYILGGFLSNPEINGQSSTLLYIVDDVTDESGVSAKDKAEKKLRELLANHPERINNITVLTAEEAIQKTNILSPVQAQSQQANYVIIDANPENTSGPYGVKRSLEFLYTMLSRTRTACLLVDKGASSLSGLQILNQDVPKALSIVKFTDQTKNNFKAFEIARLEAKRKLYGEGNLTSNKASITTLDSGKTDPNSGVGGGTIDPNAPIGGTPPTNPPGGGSSPTQLTKISTWNDMPNYNFQVLKGNLVKIGTGFLESIEVLQEQLIVNGPVVTIVKVKGDTGAVTTYQDPSGLNIINKWIADGVISATKNPKPNPPKGGGTGGSNPVVLTDAEKEAKILAALKDKELLDFSTVVKALNEKLDKYTLDAKELESQEIIDILKKKEITQEELDKLIALKGRLQTSIFSDKLTKIVEDMTVALNKAAEAKLKAEEEARKVLEEEAKREKAAKEELERLLAEQKRKEEEDKKKRAEEEAKRLAGLTLGKPIKKGDPGYKGASGKLNELRQPIMLDEAAALNPDNPELGALKIIAFRNRIFNNLNISDRFKVKVVKGKDVNVSIPSIFNTSAEFRRTNDINPDLDHWVVQAYDKESKQWITVLSNRVNPGENGTNKAGDFSALGEKEFGARQFMKLFQFASNDVSSGAKRDGAKFNLTYDELNTAFNGYISEKAYVFNPSDVDSLNIPPELQSAYAALKGKPFVFYVSDKSLLQYSPEVLFKIWMASQLSKTEGYMSYLMSGDGTEKVQSKFSSQITIDGNTYDFEAFSIRPIPLDNEILSPRAFLDRLKNQMMSLNDNGLGHSASELSPKEKAIQINKLASKYTTTELFRALYAVKKFLQDNSNIKEELKKEYPGLFNKNETLLYTKTKDIPFFELNSAKLKNGDPVLDVVLDYLEQLMPTDNGSHIADNFYKVQDDKLVNLDHAIKDFPLLGQLTPLLFHPSLQPVLERLMTFVGDQSFAAEYPLISKRFSQGILSNCNIDSYSAFVATADVDLNEAKFALGDIFNRRVYFDLSTDIPSTVGLGTAPQPQADPNIKLFSDKQTAGQDYVHGKKATMNIVNGVAKFYVTADFQDVIDFKANNVGDAIEVTISEMNSNKRDTSSEEWKLKERLFNNGFILKRESITPNGNFYVVTTLQNRQQEFSIIETATGDFINKEVWDAREKARLDALAKEKLEQDKLASVPIFTEYANKLAKYGLTGIAGLDIDLDNIVDQKSLKDALSLISRRKFSDKKLSTPWENLIKYNPIITISGDLITFESTTHKGTLDLSTGKLSRAEAKRVKKQESQADRAKALHAQISLDSYPSDRKATLQSMASALISDSIEKANQLYPNVSTDADLQIYHSIIDSILEAYSKFNAFLDNNDITAIDFNGESNTFIASNSLNEEITGTYNLTNLTFEIDQYDLVLRDIKSNLEGFNNGALIDSLLSDDSLEGLFDDNLNEPVATLKEIGKLTDTSNPNCK